jgi:ribonucleotide monophosphatase NagD (HAD superfamily)
VHRFLDRLGVRGESYDAITSTGDVTRRIVEARLAERVFHLGPPRDRPIFAGPDVDQAAAFRGGAMPPLARVLAIGDSVRTDLAGAASLGVDFLFVISGLHADQFGLCGAPALTGILAASDPAVIRRLLW